MCSMRVIFFLPGSVTGVRTAELICLFMKSGTVDGRALT